MEASIILHTTQNLGDHGREITKSIGVPISTTIEELINKLLLQDGSLNYGDHIEIRLINKLEL